MPSPIRGALAISAVTILCLATVARAQPPSQQAVPRVRPETPESLLALYRRIGESVPVGGALEAYETNAAVEAGRRVRSELLERVTRSAR